MSRKCNYEILVKKEDKIIELIDGFYTKEELIELEDSIIDELHKKFYPNNENIYWVRDIAIYRPQPTFIFTNGTVYTGIKIFKRMI